MLSVSLIGDKVYDHLGRSEPVTDKRLGHFLLLQNSIIYQWPNPHKSTIYRLASCIQYFDLTLLSQLPFLSFVYVPNYVQSSLNWVRGNYYIHLHDPVYLAFNCHQSLILTIYSNKVTDLTIRKRTSPFEWWFCFIHWNLEFKTCMDQLKLPSIPSYLF